MDSLNNIDRIQFSQLVEKSEKWEPPSRESYFPHTKSILHGAQQQAIFFKPHFICPFAATAATASAFTWSARQINVAATWYWITIKQSDVRAFNPQSEATVPLSTGTSRFHKSAPPDWWIATKFVSVGVQTQVGKPNKFAFAACVLCLFLLEGKASTWPTRHEWMVNDERDEPHSTGGRINLGGNSREEASNKYWTTA